MYFDSLKFKTIRHLLKKALRYNSATAIVFKNFWKKHVFQFFRDIWTDLPPPPHPHINVEKCYFCVACMNRDHKNNQH